MQGRFLKKAEAGRFLKKATKGKRQAYLIIRGALEVYRRGRDYQ
jgi:hypothetical protein